VLLQQSTARHARVAMSGQILLVIVFWITIVTFVPQQASWAVGMPKFHGLPGTMVTFPGQEIIGGVVSTTATSCVQMVLLLQQSVARHTPAYKLEQAPEVTTLLLISWKLRGVPAQQPDENPVGGLKVQVVPHCTVLLVAQVIVGANVLT